MHRHLCSDTGLEGLRDMFFFFNDPATTEIYTLPLPAALPISRRTPSRAHPRRRVCRSGERSCPRRPPWARGKAGSFPLRTTERSEEHTSELQSRQYLVCRLLLEKKTPLLRPARTPPRPHPLSH